MGKVGYAKMKVIVSDRLEDNYTQYMVMSSFKEVLDKIDTISRVIIHHVAATEFDVGVYVSKLNENGIKEIAYICEEQVNSIKLCVLALHGLVLDDEFYYEDEEELEVVVNDFFEEGESESTELATQTNIEIISDFITAFTHGDDKISAPVYIKQVNAALTELAEYTEKQDIVIKDFANTALDTFTKASLLINRMQETKRDLEDKLKKVEESITKGSVSRVTPKERMNQAMFFSSYQYIGGAKVLCVRELSPCRYLTSFILGFKNYLSLVKNKRVKLIICYTKSAGMGKKYNDFTSITTESKGNKMLYASDIVTTNTPNNTVMQELMHQKDDIIIVVDRLYGSQPILKKNNITLINAVSGMSDLNRYGVRPQECIFTTTRHPDNFYCIPYIKGFALDADTRRAQYMQACSDIYDKLLKYMKAE